MKLIIILNIKEIKENEVSYNNRKQPKLSELIVKFDFSFFFIFGYRQSQTINELYLLATTN